MAKRTGKFVWLWIGLWLLSFSTQAADAVEVSISEDLQRDAREAEARGVPLLLVFSADYCEYCDQLEEEFLRPMLISGDYDHRVLIRMLKLGKGSSVRDFAGRDIATDDLATGYRVRVTPTMLFLDKEGRELTPRMVGINTPEFFGGYLDRAIEEAAAALSGTPAPLAVR